MKDILLRDALPESGDAETSLEVVHLNEAMFPCVRRLFEGHVAAGDIAGAVLAVAIGDSEPCFVSVGETGMSSGLLVGPDSIHRIYSQTKPVTGVSILILIEEGLIDLDQPIGDILPALADLPVLVAQEGEAVRPARRQPTIRDLLTHTAGFTYALQASPLAARYRSEGIEPGLRISLHRSESPPPRDLKEMVERLSRLPLARDPGEMFEYSLSIDILGAIVEEVSGQPLDTFFAERIFDPLGMRDTGFIVSPDRLDRLVNLHQRRADGSWQLIDDPADSAYAKAALLSGGGGLVSTARDYIRFTAMLAGEGQTLGVRLLRPETVRLARSNLLPAGIGVQFSGYVLPDMGYGAAMQVLLTANGMPAGVFGWGGAAGTGMWVDPIHRLHMVLMTQYMPAEINLGLRQGPAIAAYRDLELWPEGSRISLI